MSTVAIWDGSAGIISGSTPFGFYDEESDFQSDGPKVANWCAKRLGYPIIDVELQSGSFYACFEEAVNEYAAQVNQFRIRDNMFTLQGSPTGSNMSQRTISSNLGSMIEIAEQYGSEAGVGGSVTWKTGSIQVVDGEQNYDLDALWADVSESGQRIEIKRVWHYQTPAIAKYFDPYAGTGMHNVTAGFGWGNFTPAVQFVVMPVWADILRMQAIEFNDQVRKSGYSFEIRGNNKLRIFPLPTYDYRLHFEYIVKSDRSDPMRYDTGQGQVQSDYSNVEFNLMGYNYINQVGRQWIKRYTLALSKEVLGAVRGKYASIPIPNSDVSMDGADLRSEAQTEKEALITELRETLEQVSKRTQMEMNKEIGENLMENLNKIPLGIYVG